VTESPTVTTPAELFLHGSAMFGQRKRLGRSTFMQDAGAVGSSAWCFGAGRMTNEGVDVAEGGYVSRRLLQLVMPIFPDRRMFRIHDPEVQPDAPGGPLPPVGVLVSATREQLWVGSLQQDIDVRLVLEEWDGQPLLPACTRIRSAMISSARSASSRAWSGIWSSSGATRNSRQGIGYR
jgi:hypothetical protein